VYSNIHPAILLLDKFFFKKIIAPYEKIGFILAIVSFIMVFIFSNSIHYYGNFIAILSGIA
jgi:hypothetical protein